MMDNNAHTDGNSVRALRDRLIGALVGLARATEGNSHKVSENTDRAMLNGLCALAGENGLNTEVLTRLLSCLDDEKRRLIPDCYGCAAPCGRNSDYDITRLYETRTTPAALRMLLLSGISSLAASVRQAYFTNAVDPEVNKYFYRVLYAVGMDDWDERELLPMAEEFIAIERRCAELSEK